MPYSNKIIKAFRDDLWVYKTTHQAVIAWLSAWNTLRRYDTLFQNNPEEVRKAKKVFERLYIFTKPE